MPIIFRPLVRFVQSGVTYVIHKWRKECSVIGEIKRLLGLVGRRTRPRGKPRSCRSRKTAPPAWATAPTDAYPVGFNQWIQYDRLRLTPAQAYRAGVGSR